MKNVLLLGATGTAGSALTKKLLSDTDCHLTLFARHARDMYADNDRIAVVNGDAESLEALKAIMPGHDVVFCAVSGNALPKVADNIVAAMTEVGVKRLIFMGAVGIYNEIPDEIDGDDNLDNEPAQIPNRKAVDVVEASSLNYTVLRPGYLGEGDEDDYVLTVKGEAAKGYTTPIPALVKFAVQLITANVTGMNFSVSGNKLTITTDTAPTGTVTISATKSQTRSGIIVWSDGKTGGGVQDTITYSASVSDPVKASLKVKVSYGAAKIIKTSEDGNVSGITFTIVGEGINETRTTDKNGAILVENLMPGTYTVTEQSYDKYEPQETRRVTVVAGQTATVSFNNVLILL